MTEEDTGLWIATEPTVDGKAFVVVVRVGKDQAFTLDRDQAFAHARTLLTGVAMAEYDAAIFKQIMDTGKLTEDDAVLVVRDFQADRAPFDPTGTPPFTYLPGLARPSREPVIVLEIEGKRWGAMDMEQARTHAYGLIEATAAADLDGAYYRTLRGVIGMPEESARRMVQDIRAWR